MMYNVEILKPAWEDIERIADIHLSLVGPQSAKKVTDGILDSIDSLKMFPFGYRTVPDIELAESGYRMVIYKRYVSVYRVIDNTVYVYHVFDSRTNYPQLLKGHGFAEGE